MVSTQLPLGRAAASCFDWTLCYQLIIGDRGYFDVCRDRTRRASEDAGLVPGRPGSVRRRQNRPAVRLASVLKDSPS